MTMPAIRLRTKNAAILIRTMPILTLGSAKLVISVRAIIPRISSINAAPRIALPERVDSFPISLSVSTVMLTEVAVRMTPIKTFCKNASDCVLKMEAMTNPPASGTITPIKAIRKDALPERLSSPISVSRPAVNISTITPISAI